MAYNANYANVYAPASSTYYYIIEVAVSEDSYNVDTNKSRVYLEADITGNGIRFEGSDNQNLAVIWHDSKNGDITGTSANYKSIQRDTLNQITCYIDVPHNDDGTLSGYAKTIWTKNGSNSYVPPSTNVTANLTLTTIPRKSTTTISGTPNIGSTITINTNRKSSSFTHTLLYSFGSLSGTIATNVGASTTWTIPTTFYAQIPNATSGTCTITCKTYNGTTLVGETTTNITCYVTNSNPTFNVAYKDTNSTTLAITGNNQQIIQNKSTIQFNITSASAKNSATLSNVKVTINGVTQTQSISGATLNFNYGTANVSSNINASVTLTDSRGLTTTKQVALTILSWSSPTAIITLQRKSNYYSDTDIKVDANYSSLASHNTISIKYRYKKKTASSWSSYVTLSDNVTATFTADNQYEWDVQVVVQDNLATTTYNLTLGVGQPILFIDRTKRNVGVDCFPQSTNAFEVQGNAKVTGTLNVTSTTTLGGNTSVTGTLKVNGANVLTSIPTASSSTLGGIKVGNNLSISSGVLSMSPTNLYNNTSGSNTSVTLSQTSANFTYLEIFYRVLDLRNSIKVYSPNGQKVGLFGVTNESTLMQIGSATATISGTSITISNAQMINVGVGTCNNWNASNIYIVRVDGYK